MRRHEAISAPRPWRWPGPDPGRAPGVPAYSAVCHGVGRGALVQILLQVCPAVAIDILRGIEGARIAAVRAFPLVRHAVAIVCARTRPERSSGQPPTWAGSLITSPAERPITFWTTCRSRRSRVGGRRTGGRQHSVARHFGAPALRRSAAETAPARDAKLRGPYIPPSRPEWWRGRCRTARAALLEWTPKPPGGPLRARPRRVA